MSIADYIHPIPALLIHGPEKCYAKTLADKLLDPRLTIHCVPFDPAKTVDPVEISKIYDNNKHLNPLPTFVTRLDERVTTYQKTDSPNERHLVDGSFVVSAIDPHSKHHLDNAQPLFAALAYTRMGPQSSPSEACIQSINKTMKAWAETTMSLLNIAVIGSLVVFVAVLAIHKGVQSALMVGAVKVATIASVALVGFSFFRMLQFVWLRDKVNSIGYLGNMISLFRRFAYQYPELRLETDVRFFAKEEIEYLGSRK